jgi:hypothetical protein
VKHRHSSLTKEPSSCSDIFGSALTKTQISDFVCLNVYSSLRIVNAGGRAISMAVSHLSVSGSST